MIQYIILHTIDQIYTAFLTTEAKLLACIPCSLIYTFQNQFLSIFFESVDSGSDELVFAIALVLSRA